MTTTNGGRRPDPADPGDVDALMAASKVVVAAVAHSLSAVDAEITMPQLRALVMIGGRGPMNLSAVAEGLAVSPSNASRACDRLVGSGLLDRRADEQDRRHLVLTLSERGEQVLSAVLQRREEIFRQVLERMVPRDRRALATSMAAFTDAAEELSAAGQLSDDRAGHLLRWLP